MASAGNCAADSGRAENDKPLKTQYILTSMRRDAHRGRAHAQLCTRTALSLVGIIHIHICKAMIFEFLQVIDF